MTKDIAINSPVATRYVTHTSHKYGELTAENLAETVPVPVPDFQGVPTASVHVEAAMTKNLGNFESARITCGITLPCFPTDMEIAKTYDLCQELVQEMMQEQLDGLKK